MSARYPETAAEAWAVLADLSEEQRQAVRRLQRLALFAVGEHLQRRADASRGLVKETYTMAAAAVGAFPMLP